MDFHRSRTSIIARKQSVCSVLVNRKWQVTGAEGGHGSYADALTGTPLARQRLKAGDHIEQLFVDGFLPNAM